MPFHNNSVLVRAGLDFVNATENFFWDENSPLPPGVRYMELADIYAAQAYKWSDPAFEPDRQAILDLTEDCLPKDKNGNIRRNLRPCGVDVSSFNGQPLSLITSAPDIAAQLATIYEDDGMWTGEVVDPVLWHDDWWDFLQVSRERMQIYLDAHPGCRLNA